MVKRIIWIVVALVVIGVFYLGYRTYDTGRALSSGDVQTDNSRSTKSTTPIATPPPNQTIVYPAPNEPGGTGSTSQSSGLPVPSTTSIPSDQAPPPGDTLSPNPPENLRFGGSGRYQLYRQGNLTYRLDTDTGQSCIIYATDDEWKKPRVLRNACPKK
jgi:hypothetical protein